MGVSVSKKNEEDHQSWPKSCEDIFPTLAHQKFRHRMKRSETKSAKVHLSKTEVKSIQEEKLTVYKIKVKRLF